MITIYKNIYAKEPNYISVEKALERIKTGKSKDLVLEIRKQLDKERANKLKQNLPSVCFSGKFSERTDAGLLEHSGYVCLDFDNLFDLNAKKNDLSKDKYVFACWVSPSGNGLKALVKIADKSKHREHFEAMLQYFKDLDRSGVNVSRVCYESWDEEIYVNEKSEVWTKFVKTEKVKTKEVKTDYGEIFQHLLKWLSNKGDAFVKGERNVFMFKLASACNRFGISQDDCIDLCKTEFVINDNSFSENELYRVVKSAYKNINIHATATFENEKLIEKKTRHEVELDADIFNPDIKPKDVIFGEDVKSEAMRLYDTGFDSLDGIGVEELDSHFKLKRGEISLLTGIGNYGKSTFLKWYLLMRIIKHKEKFALFAPEDNPAQEFYHDLVEIYLGANCTPSNPRRPSRIVYESAYDYISKHFFYVYPKEIAPTPDYVKERFLELIIKEKISGCVIDPFNQMSNDYNSSGGRTDKYLETFLSDCSRFAQLNNVYFMIVAHPKLMRKDNDGNYPCPDVFDVADGAMWNNKMDNILVYHRPNHQLNPSDQSCELHTKKIRRQKTVGKKGIVIFEYVRSARRYIFNGVDVMANEAAPKQESIKLTPAYDFLNEDKGELPY
jgi:hypothetical protein